MQPVTVQKMYTHWVLLEPGDGTKYEFAVTPRHKGLVHIVSLGGVKFPGYNYRRSEILEFVARYPEIYSAGYRECQDVVHRIDPMPDYFLGYMREPGHSPCNPWTGLAAIGAAASILDGSAVMEE